MSLKLEVKPRSDNLEKAIAFVSFPVPPLFKILLFSNIKCFFEPLFAYNLFNMGIDLDFECFWNFEVRPQNDNFAKAMALAKFPF